MRFALMTEPQQGLAYPDILAVARAAEAAGFEAFLRSDHYASFLGGSGRPTTDAWATLAGLARETARIRLGVLVSPVTFRIPGAFAKLVTTVDEMSDGRVEVGMGAGWNALEHAQLGIPYPASVGERFERLEEAVAIVHGLWTGPDGWTYAGRHWQVGGSLYRPSPALGGRRHPHLILGGDGKPRGLRLAAAHADEYNLASPSPEAAAAVGARLRQACEATGRDPATLVFSVMTGVLVAESDADLRDRMRELLAEVGPGGDATAAEAWLAARRGRWIVGRRDEALERIAAFAAAGVERIALQDFLPRDLAQVRLLGERILPAV